MMAVMYEMKWIRSLSLVCLSLLTTGYAFADMALAQKNACMGCHATNAKVYGPSFSAIAERYKATKDAQASLALKIRAGTKGAWGPDPMPPMAQVSEADATKLAGWILSGGR